MAIVINITRIACIVTVATSMSIGSTNLHDLFASKLPTAVNQLFTGSSDSSPDSINKNLIFTVAAMSAIDAVQVPTNDVATPSQKARAPTGSSSAPPARPWRWAPCC